MCYSVTEMTTPHQEEPMLPTTQVSDLYLPFVRRKGSVVKVDTFGGHGSRATEDGDRTKIKNITGTVSLRFDEENDAALAQEILKRWSDADDLVTVEQFASTSVVQLVNQRTGQRVGTVVR